MSDYKTPLSFTMKEVAVLGNLAFIILHRLRDPIPLSYIKTFMHLEWLATNDSRGHEMGLDPVSEKCANVAKVMLYQREDTVQEQRAASVFMSEANRGYCGINKPH